MSDVREESVVMEWDASVQQYLGTGVPVCDSYREAEKSAAGLTDYLNGHFVPMTTSVLRRKVRSGEVRAFDLDPAVGQKQADTVILAELGRLLKESIGRTKALLEEDQRGLDMIGILMEEAERDGNDEVLEALGTLLKYQNEGCPSDLSEIAQ